VGIRVRPGEESGAQAQARMATWGHGVWPSLGWDPGPRVGLARAAVAGQDCEELESSPAVAMLGQGSMALGS